MRKPFNIFSGSILFAALTLLAACDQMGGESFETTESGLAYRFIEGNADDPIEEGQIMLLNMTYLTEDDSLLFNTDERGGAVPIRIDSAAGGIVYEGFSMMNEGDSAVFRINAREVFENTFQTEVPEFIDPESTITFQVGVDDVMSEDDFRAYQMEMMRKQQEEMLAQQQQQMEIDSTKIEQYLDNNSIDAQTTDSGLRYVIREEGTGPQPSPGDTVYVHYTGRILDGEEFDSSYERGEPLAFPIGQGRVIPGWDEGIALLNEGGEATLYIPSPLAYGQQARGDVIRENSILVFDVELVDVEQASN
jgi:FKBP-type peptidyl-prolyl cis-trans isomerase